MTEKKKKRMDQINKITKELMKRFPNIKVGDQDSKALLEFIEKLKIEPESP